MKKKSPFLNAYSNPGGVSASFAKTNAEPITFQSINEEGVVEGTSDDGGNPTAEKLKKESKVYQPGLHRKLAKAKSRFKEQKIQSKIDNKTIKDEGKAARVKIKKAIPQAKKIKNQNQKTANLIERKADRKETLIKNKKMEQEDFKGSALKYINPNTLAVQGDAGMQENNMSGVPAPEQQEPSRAGRPVNSNVLINDPNNYQDPSKISAQQNNQAQMFSGLAQMGNNPNPIMDNNINNSVMPGDQPSPFNKNGVPGDGRKKPTANTTRASSTGVAKPAGWGSEQLKTDAVTDHVLGMRDMGFYSNKYAMDRIAGKMGYPASTYEIVRHPASDSTAVERAIAKGPKKSEPKPEMKMLRSVKALEPKKKLMATRTMAKIKKKPLEKMTPKPAKKLEGTPLKKKDWIQGAIKKPGQLRKDLGVAEGEKIPKSKLNAAADGKYGKKTQQRANLAKTLSKFKK